MKNEKIVKIENGTQPGTPISDPLNLPSLGASDLPLTRPLNPPSARANSILRLSRIGSTIRQLGAGQLDKLIRWLSQHPIAEVERMAAAPPPDGFSLNIHYTTLRRLKARLDAGDIADELERLTDLCHDATEQAGQLDLDNIRSVISGVVHKYVLHAVQKTGDPGHITKLVDALAKLSAIEHKQQKLALDREKLRSSSAAHSSQHHRVDLNILPLKREEQLKSKKSLAHDAPPQLIETATFHDIAGNEETSVSEKNPDSQAQTVCQNSPS